MATIKYEDYNILKLKFKESSRSSHHVFIKPHSARIDEELRPKERTLFCTNIPPWATADSIKRIFHMNGPIEQIYMDGNPSFGVQDGDGLFKLEVDSVKGFQSAHIVFEKQQGLRNTMSKMDLSKEYVASTDENPIVTGVKKWAIEYNEKWNKMEKIEANVADFMKIYDEKVAEEKEVSEKMEEPDEDGWVTISRVEKSKPVKTVKEGVELRGGKGKKNRRKKKKLELKHFYSHQISEEKKDKIQELRKKFEEDKLKIAKMKSERKFKPF